MIYRRYSQKEQYRTLPVSAEYSLGCPHAVLSAEKMSDSHLSIRQTRSILGLLRVYTLELRVLAV